MQSHRPYCRAVAWPFTGIYSLHRFVLCDRIGRIGMLSHGHLQEYTACIDLFYLTTLDCSKRSHRTTKQPLRAMSFKFLMPLGGCSTTFQVFFSITSWNIVEAYKQVIDVQYNTLENSLVIIISFCKIKALSLYHIHPSLCSQGFFFF